MTEEKKNPQNQEQRDNQNHSREREIYTEERGRILPEVSELEIPSELPRDDN